MVRSASSSESFRNTQVFFYSRKPWFVSEDQKKNQYLFQKKKPGSIQLGVVQEDQEKDHKLGVVQEDHVVSC